MLVFGERWGRADRCRRARIGVQLQRPAFVATARVGEVVRLATSFQSQGPSAQELLQRLDLERLAQRPVRALSGGEHQRLALAWALAGDPELLILDEPTAGLDPAARRALWDVLLDLSEAGASLLICSHDMQEVEELCTRLAFLKAGRVVAEGSPSELAAHGAHAQPVASTPPGALERAWLALVGEGWEEAP